MKEEEKLREINSLSEQTSSGDGSSAESCMLESEYERLEKEGKIKNRVYVCGLGWMLPTVTVYGCGCGCGCGCGEEGCGCGEEGCGYGYDDFCPNCGQLKDHCYCGYGCGEDDDEEDEGNNNIIVPDIPGYNGGNGGGGWTPGNDPVHAYIDEIVDITDIPAGLVESISDAVEYTAEDTRIGNNGRLYYRNINGNVFHGNQHVSTMSLKALGQAVNLVAENVGNTITVFSLINNGIQGDDEGFREDVIDVFADFLVGRQGIVIGAEIGAMVCPGPIGICIGAVVGDIVLNYMVSEGLDYLVEISFNKNNEKQDTQ